MQFWYLIWFVSVFFFFKQKTAYEMRISDWSSDVCSSDLGFATGGSFRVGGAPGIDKNLVAFRATRGEMVDIRKPGNDNGGVVVVHVQANDYFDAKVAQGAAQVATPMAVRAGTYASQDAQQSMSRRARRTKIGRAHV